MTPNHRCRDSAICINRYEKTWVLDVGAFSLPIVFCPWCGENLDKQLVIVATIASAVQLPVVTDWTLDMDIAQLQGWAIATDARIASLEELTTKTSQ